MQTLDILRDLIAFATVSADPNRALIDYCADMLQKAGASVQIIEDASAHKANLYATIGPLDRPGVMLSGHTDVVPVTGQAWTTAPFALSVSDGKAYGRGSADMKGFIASALSMALRAAESDLQTPLHLAFSYDEEIGCVGVHSMIAMLAAAPITPAFCIVGEPTSLRVATGHKGKMACRMTCTGREGHSALAPMALNAIHLAVDMITAIRGIQSKLMASGHQDPDYDVPYTSLHVGRIEAGVALNIVPKTCTCLFEIRNLPEDDPEAILAQIIAAADEILGPVRPSFPEAAIEFEVTNRYPSLGTPHDAEVVTFVQSLLDASQSKIDPYKTDPSTADQSKTIKVAFGTEGGLFHRDLGVPSVICGPGSMAQGHKPDEFVSLDQLQQCDALLAALLERLKQGI